jgi:psp operon transcriptional activator
MAGTHRGNTSDTSEVPQRPVIEALGQSESFLQFQERLSRLAKVDRPVLIIGERGSGKELAAARLHYLSKRWEEPFVALNCAALASTLIESELFGHEEGSFTGAGRKRTGRFETANDGTLFLDEIALIPITTQEKILRVVEYGSFERVGSSQSTRVNVRIVGATNANLSKLASEGRFMRDLLDRLSFEVLFIPPLRERKEDIMFLANHFAARMAMELAWSTMPEFTEEAIDALEEYAWPGNVRELKNVVERAVYRSEDSVITIEECVFDPFLSPYAADYHRQEAAAETVGDVKRILSERSHLEKRTSDESPIDRSFENCIQELELNLMRRAMKQAKFNQRKAAELLGLTYHQFRGLYRKYQTEFE